MGKAAGGQSKLTEKEIDRIVTLRDRHGLDFGTIGQRMGWSGNTVLQAYRRAKGITHTPQNRGNGRGEGFWR